MFGDRGVDDTPAAEFLQQALRHLVGALIFGDLLPDDEHGLVAAHFFRHGVAQRFAHRHGDHLGAFRKIGLGQRLQLPRRADLRHRRRVGGFDLHLRLLRLGGGRGRRGLLCSRRRSAVGQCGGVLALA